jgi:glycosyltransferase involved in cell wall biosynthesis
VSRGRTVSERVHLEVISRRQLDSTSVDAERKRGRVLMVHALGGMRGPARSMASLALSVTGWWDVDVAAPDGFLASIAHGAPSIRVCQLPRYPFRPLSWMLGSIAILRFVRRGPRPDVIHANGLSALNLCALTALRRRLPVLVHFHGYEVGGRSRVLALLWRRLGVRFALHPVSGESRAVLVRAGLSASVRTILPNPIAIPTSTVQPSTGRRLRIGFLGSPSKRKGLHVLVDMIDGLRDEPFTWLVFGVDPETDTAYVQRCRSLLSDRGLEHLVSWEGSVEDIDSAYQRMDVLLVPSLQESWCRVAMEGMAVGLPVVGTDIPGMRELFARVKGAMTFPLDRPEVGREQLRTLSRNDNLRLELSRRGREAMQAFELPAVRDQLLPLYAELARRYVPGEQRSPGS